MNKYHARKVRRDGMTFDSAAEYDRWRELLLMQRAGAISGLERQVRFELVPSQKENGKVVERGVSYVADFVYQREGETVVEDVKGVKTPEYIIKRKLMLARHGIRIREVRK